MSKRLLLRRLVGSGMTLLAATTTLTAGASGAASPTPPLRASSVSRGPVAVAARRLYLTESASLRLIGEGETTLNERGRGTGTFSAPLTARLNLSPSHVTGTFTIYPKGGSISGITQARFILKGSIGYYGGTLTITHGTGHYRHASGAGIGISGTINHLSFALTVKAHGWMNF
jgi:hypothetical protein